MELGLHAPVAVGRRLLVGRRLANRPASQPHWPPSAGPFISGCALKPSGPSGARVTADQFAGVSFSARYSQLAGS